MDREIRLDVLTEGDVIVVSGGEANGDDEYLCSGGGVEVRVAECNQQLESPTKIKIIEIYRESREVVAVPASRPSLDEKYSVGEVISVVIDESRSGDGYLNIDMGREIKVVDYPHVGEEVEAVVEKITENEVTAKRRIEVDKLSPNSLAKVGQKDDCHIVVDDSLSEAELNVFISHAIASSNIDLLEHLLSSFDDVEKVDISTLKDRVDLQKVSSGVWRDMLYTVTHELPELVPSVGVDYAASSLQNHEIPRAWESRVLGNLSVVLKRHDVDIKHHELKISDDQSASGTVSPQVLNVDVRESRTRDTKLNRELKDIWQERCSVCSNLAESRHDKTGIEGSHIYPVKLGGPDEKGNVLPMCRNHHWGFENGWFSISDDYEAILHENVPDGVHNLLNISEGDELHLIEGYEPNADYIQLHRRIHGFEEIEPGQIFPVRFEKPEFSFNSKVTVRIPNGMKISIPIDSLNEEKEANERLIRVGVQDVQGNEIEAIPLRDKYGDD